MNSPLISIITPTYNSAKTIEKTILSILHQVYKEIELVIIDGLSEDDTTSIIRAYQDQFKHFYFISEKDNGIYDAMNKGLDHCTGDWIYFMGSDDLFYNEGVLTELAEQGFFQEEQIVYGNVMINGDTIWARDKSIYDGPFNLEKLFRINICHQSIFYPRSVIQHIGYYSEKYGITADWDYNVRCYAKYKFTYTDKIISVFHAGGKSSVIDDGKFYDDFPQKIIDYFQINPYDPAVFEIESPFYHPMARYRESLSRKFNLNPIHREIENGISLFTAIKNRKETFEEALKTWITFDQIDEIIIVDWDSDESLLPIIEKYQNGKIYLAVVKDQPKWILSHAYNLAARLTTKDKVLKVDADIKLLPGFFENHDLKPGKFYSGNWAIGRNENETHLNGNAYFFRNDFYNVNGYNEYIKSYGWDDTDLFTRLEMKGLLRLDFDITKLHHIEHQARTVNQNPSKYLMNISDEEWARHNILTNRYLATNFDYWSDKNTMLDFRVEVLDKHIFICDQIGVDTNLYPAHLVNTAVTSSITDRLNELGIDLPMFLQNQITKEELIGYFNLYLSKDISDQDRNRFLLMLKIIDLFKTFSNQKNEEIILLNNVIQEQGNKIIEQENLNNEIKRQLSFTKMEISSMSQSYSWKTGHFFFSIIAKFFFWVPSIRNQSRIDK